MRADVDMEKVVPAAFMRGEDAEETDLLRGMLAEAYAYFERFTWHRGVSAADYGLGVPGIIAIFLFEFEPSRPEMPDKVWIVVGDLPPAYIDVGDAPNPATALDGYIGAMSDWVDAAKSGRSVAGLIPVNVDPTYQNAEELESRVRFLDDSILSLYEEDLGD